MSGKSSAQLAESASVSALNCIDLSSPDIQSSVSLLKQETIKRDITLALNCPKMILMHKNHSTGQTCGRVQVIRSDILPAWRETMEKYHQKALEVAKTVSRLIAQALDLKFDFFDQSEMLGKPIAVLRLLHYADEVSEPAKGIFGAGAHSDFGLITLLATDDVVGLQICRDKDANPQIWEYVPPLKGAFIVNLGDMLERWSNCTFRSTLHRVVCTGRERYSIAYFVEPNHDCIVECLPTCQSQKNPPMFPPIKCQDYLQMRYKDTHNDLNSYRVSK